MAAFHLTLWLHTLVELWAWKQPAAVLRDRRDSPWDDPDRRPSHADRCKALRRRCLGAEIRALRPSGRAASKLRSLARRLIRLVA